MLKILTIQKYLDAIILYTSVLLCKRPNVTLLLSCPKSSVAVVKNSTNIFTCRPMTESDAELDCTLENKSFH